VSYLRPIDDNEASRRREATYRNAVGSVVRSTGDGVYAVTRLGLVIAVLETRILIPWHNVINFAYHTQDTAARKVIQGY
jgi:hypothetical protein